MQTQIQILNICPRCEGDAYVPDQLITGESGQKRLSYEACWDCGGTGRQLTWIDLSELLEMLAEHDQRDPMEPDYLTLLARNQPAISSTAAKLPVSDGKAPSRISGRRFLVLFLNGE